MLKKIMKAVGVLVLVLVLAFAGLLVFLQVTEYKPEPVETALTGKPDGAYPSAKPGEHNSTRPAASAAGKAAVKAGKDLTAITYNIGYGGLGENQDFFMDGGSMVIPPAESDVEHNVRGLTQELKNLPADLYLLQEVDLNGRRSYGHNEVADMSHALGMEYAFAYNYKVRFVPYPWPPLGSVASGLQTLSPHQQNQPQRVALPVPFSWPVRLANLKRCLLVSRIPIEGSDKELVVVNLHLEAYDDGEGKAAQTKALRTLLEKEYAAGNYVIAAGDWNQALPGAPDIPARPEAEWKPGRLTARDLPAGWTVAVDPETPTNRLNNRPYKGNEDQAQLWALDGFLLSPNIEQRQLKVIDTGFAHADHKPVELKFRLKPAATHKAAN